MGNKVVLTFLVFWNYYLLVSVSTSRRKKFNLTPFITYQLSYISSAYKNQVSVYQRIIVLSCTSMPEFARQSRASSSE